MPSQLEALLDQDIAVEHAIPLHTTGRSIDNRMMKGLPRRGRAVSGPPVLSQPAPVMTVRLCDVEMKDVSHQGIWQQFVDGIVLLTISSSPGRNEG